MHGFALPEDIARAAIIEPTRHQPLWIGADNARATVAALLKRLPAGLCERIEVVAIDRASRDGLEFKARCPRAGIAYDLFSRGRPRLPVCPRP